MMKKSLGSSQFARLCRLLAAALVLLLLLTGCNLGSFKKQKLERNFSNGAENHYFESFSEVEIFYESYKKNNAGSFVLVDPEKLGATDSYFFFSGFSTVPESGASATNTYETCACGVNMLIRYRLKEYHVAVFHTLGQVDNSLDFHDSQLWSWKEESRQGGIYNYQYYYNNQLMMTLGWVSDFVSPNEKFLNQVIDAILVLK